MKYYTKPSPLLCKIIKNITYNTDISIDYGCFAGNIFNEKKPTLLYHQDIKCIYLIYTGIPETVLPETVKSIELSKSEILKLIYADIHKI